MTGTNGGQVRLTPFNLASTRITLPGTISHNIWLTYIRELNRLEEKLASIKSALRGEEVPPVVHSPPKKAKQPLAVSRRDMPVAEIKRLEDVDAEQAEVKAEIEAILKPDAIIRDMLYEGDKLKPTAARSLQRLRDREAELSRRATALVGF